MTEFSVTYEGDLKTRAVNLANGQALFTDAPTDNYGKGEYFSPTDLLAVALGTCILTIMGMTAKRIGVDLRGGHMTVKKEMAASPIRRIGKLYVDFYFPRKLEEAQIQQLEKAGLSCPVHASLHPDVEQKIVFHWGEP
jgi:putative redox protein